MKNKCLFSIFFLLTCTFVLPMLASAQEIKNALLIANGEYGNEIAALNEPMQEPSLTLTVQLPKLVI